LHDILILNIVRMQYRHLKIAQFACVLLWTNKIFSDIAVCEAASNYMYSERPAQNEEVGQ